VTAVDGLSSAVLAQGNGRIESKVSKPTCVSTSNPIQNIERWRVDWNEQRPSRSLGQSILVKPAQPQIHTSSSRTKNFSFAAARHEGKSQQYS